MRARAAQAIVLCGLLIAFVACGDSSGDKDKASNAAPSLAVPRCSTGEMRECACLGAGVGVQVCNAAGGFDPCVGCVPPGAISGSGGSGPTPVAGTGTGTDTGGTSPVANTGGGAASVPDAGEFTTDVGSAPGTSCGEALPGLCALGTEKCCVRSLKTDNCIAVAETCDCDLPDCTVMEATCDGPEDCTNGEVCCGTLNGFGGGYTSFRCAATCVFNQPQREACHEDATTCPPALVCSHSQLLSNVQVCIDPASIQQ